jgi:hypothetical protein
MNIDTQFGTKLQLRFDSSIKFSYDFGIFVYWVFGSYVLCGLTHAVSVIDYYEL